jgi:ATP-dependent RNA helicase DDX24/MAK5
VYLVYPGDRRQILGSVLKLRIQDDELAASVRRLRFLIIDEADRMIETGHFAELENIVGLTQRKLRYVTVRSLDWKTDQCSKIVNPDDEDPTFKATATLLTSTAAREDMQTFVFSATLSKDLQQNLKRKGAFKSKKGKGKKATALGGSGLGAPCCDVGVFADENQRTWWRSSTLGIPSPK